MKFTTFIASNIVFISLIHINTFVQGVVFNNLCFYDRAMCFPSIINPLPVQVYLALVLSKDLITENL